MATMTELDELAVRAANDRSLSGSGLDRVLVSVILRTRRRWASMSEQRFAGPGIPPGMESTSEGFTLPES
jgi:hypothetical protein